MTKVTDQKQMWVVCCEPRVVVAGWATSDEVNKEFPVLTDVRLCVYWDKETGGPHGLARIGPQAESRVTKAAPEQRIRTKVETVLLCSADAVKAWEVEPWS